MLTIISICDRFKLQQESIPTRCVPPACQPYVLSVCVCVGVGVHIEVQWTSLNGSSEDVTNGGTGPWLGWRGVPMSHIWSHCQGGSCIIGNGRMEIPLSLLPVDRLTHLSENITFQQLHLRALKFSIMHVWDTWRVPKLKVFKNPSLLHRTFTMHRPRAHSINQWWSQH